ncbi:restriction endonuclease subunit S [Halopseudomonas pachastrellae]|nr:restriction endonuclease subunit S [Halopseudomonas pachastrellae]
MLAPSVKLGEVIDLIGGGTPSKSNESFYNGDIPWATVRDMKQEQLCSTEFQISEEAVRKSSTNIIEAGNIITATRVGLGKVCILQQDTAINQDLKALIPKDSRLDKQYLFWWLKSVAHVIEAAGTGATVKGVKIPFIKALDIPLPSISEQKRTVAILDQAFADIDKARALTEQNLKNACELFESYLQQVFSQRGEGWVECSLGDVAEFKNGLNFSKNSKGEHVKIAGVKDFQSNYVISANEFETAQVDGELSESYELVEGDILTVRSNGNKRLIGRCALVEKISHKTSFSGFIIRIRLMSQNIDPKFLTYYLKSSGVHEMLIGSGGGANISNLNQQTLTRLPVTYPPLDDQLAIVTMLGEININPNV